MPRRESRSPSPSDHGSYKRSRGYFSGRRRDDEKRRTRSRSRSFERSYRNSRRNDSRRDYSREHKDVKPGVKEDSTSKEEDVKKAERLAKLQAWKAERERKIRESSTLDATSATTGATAAADKLKQSDKVTNVNSFGLGGKLGEGKTEKMFLGFKEEDNKRTLTKLPEWSMRDANTIETETDDVDFKEEGISPNNVEPQSQNGEESIEGEIDPLDAYMCGLADSQIKLGKSTRDGESEESRTFLGDEDDDGIKQDEIEGEADNLLLLASGKKKKKEMPVVDHSKMVYEAFRKEFYREPLELAEKTEEEVARLREELDGIKVRGVNVPKPIQKWTQCGLGVPTLEVIQKLGYAKPTAIQAQAIPAIMSGRDVIGIAKTGSGKTIAFMIPMFRHIKDQRSLENMEGPIGLIMTPTRELCTQIFRECKPFVKALGLRAVCAYGGAPIKDQIAEFKRGAEVVVCTPGRMIDLLAANSGRVTNLGRITYVVLDEADRMFDMGFEPQVMKILGNIRPDRQTVLFSATFPRNMEALARKTLTKPIEINVGGKSVVAPEIRQIVEVREENTKFVRLLGLLGDLYNVDEDARTLVFVDRQESAEGLLNELLRKGYPCQSIHGGKNQEDRDSNVSDFKHGAIPILIATSVAARGLDIKQLKLVVNYDVPNHMEDYVHRAGRTGRAGNTGTAVTFVTPEQERYSVDIAKALRQSGQEVPGELQALVDSFMEKVKAGKEKVSGSGFGGKGLERLDRERDAARNRERKAYKTGDEGDDDEKEVEREILDDEDSTTQVATSANLLNANMEDKIRVQCTELPAIRLGTGDANTLDKVAQAVQNISNRLTKHGPIGPGQAIDNKGPDAGAFHARLEINDFPQKARWAVTNRTNVAKILEATGTSITTKGNYYAAGKTPQAGEQPKLYILVEGDTELAVTNAMRELLRLLKEATMAVQEGESRAPTARYKVT